MGQILLLAFPMSIGWVILTNQLALDNLILGYLIGVGILLLVRAERDTLKVARLPSQLFWLGVYVLRLGWDILRSSIDVALLVLRPRLSINPGFERVSTQDPTQDPLIGAISAHAITITPGEMVVDFDENDPTIMVVHCLDIESARKTLNHDQSERLKLIKRILGHD